MRSILTATLICLFSLLVVSTAGATTRVALVIGNSNYENLTVLRNPENDAQAMASVLEELGFEVSLKIDADRRGMARAIRDFGRRLRAAGSDSVGLFFYAGHGVQAGNANYLMPLHSEVVGEADLEIEAVDANWVLTQMEEAGNVLNIVILDACRNNPYRGSFRSAERGLARINAPAGSVVAYSAAPGQVAMDGDGDNSPYTSALIEAMREPGVELLRMFRQVRIEVESQTGGDQTPWEEQSLRGDFFFTEAETEVAAIAPEEDHQATIPTTPPPQYYDDGADITFWTSVKDSLNPAELQAYLDAFPNGTFRALAEIRIARLNANLEEEADTPDSSGIQPGTTAVVNPGWLGVQMQEVTQDIAESLGLDVAAGALISEVVTGGPADIAGLQPGDVIVRLNGSEIDNMADLPVMTSAIEAGKTIVIVVFRGRGEVAIAVTLASLADRERLIAEDQQRRGEQQQAAIAPQPQPQPQPDTSESEGLTNEEQAEEWYQVGEQYYYGDGARQDYAEAVQWYLRAAKFDHAESLYSLGYMYAEGQGVAQDYVEAADWHRRAAEQDHAASIASLGWLYWEGLGVGQDYRESARWHRRAADLGYSYSMVSVAILLDEGRGVTADPAAAAKYLVDAYLLGNEDAQGWLFNNSDQWAHSTRREVQRILQAAGYYDGQIDGALGPASRSALEAYKRKHGN
jgi:hypothetical protein